MKIKNGNEKTQFKKGFSPWNKGLTKENSDTLAKMSKSLLGKHLTQESKEKIKQNAKTNPNFGMSGKKHSKETIEKMSAIKQKEKHPYWKGGAGIFRKLMEEKIGRQLQKTELVHHIDGNRKNNDVDNLCLLRHQAAHMRLHFFAKRHGLKIEQLKFDQPWLQLDASN